MTVNKESIFDSFDKFNEIIESYGVGFNKSYEDMLWFNYRFFLGKYNLSWLEVSIEKDAFHKKLNFDGRVEELFGVVNNLTFIPKSGRNHKEPQKVLTPGSLILLLNDHFEYFYITAKDDRIMRESLLKVIDGCNQNGLHLLPPHLIKFSFEMADGSFPITKKNQLIKKKDHRDNLFCVLVYLLKEILGIYPTANRESEGRITGCGLVTEWYSKKFENGIDILRGRAVEEAWRKCEWRENIDESAYKSHSVFLICFLEFDRIESDFMVNKKDVGDVVGGLISKTLVELCLPKQKKELMKDMIKKIRNG